MNHSRYNTINKKHPGKVAMAVALAGLLAVPLTADAVKASPRPITVTEPDGAQIEIVKRGDERHHDIYSTDGQLLMLNPEGYYVYATVGADGMPRCSSQRVAVSRRSNGEYMRPAAIDSEAVENARRKALDVKARAIGDKPKYIFSGNAFPATGDPHAIVVLVEFQDQAFSMNNPGDFYDRQLNSDHFVDYGATGSARDYFVRNSKGLFTPTFDVYGPILLKENYEYYGANDNRYEEDLRPDQMVLEACAEIAKETDLSIYDHDKDGYIDNIFVIYAGYGEADTNDKNTVWPHSADLTDFDVELPIYNGVKPNRYGCTNEIDGFYKRPDGIGTFVHEFSHVLGLPDLYDPYYRVTSTPGDWSVLDSGSYNNQGRTPPEYSIHERYALNWMEPKTIDATGDYTLPNIVESNEGFIIPTETEDEFYLLENRQRVYGDQFIPGHGMLVWHIAFDQAIWDRNTPNSVSSKQRIDLVEADNRGGEKTASYDSFPGQTNNTSLDFTTTPRLASWAGKSLGVALSGINETDGIISFHAEVDKSAVIEVESDQGITISCADRLMSSSSPQPIPVYNAAGMVIGYISAHSSLMLPHPGFYIAGASKFIVR